MKKFAKVLFLAVLTLTVTGCFGRIVDWNPVELEICIQDRNGNDLLDPSSQKFIGEDISLTYKEEEYRYSKPTKYYMPDFYGLKIINSYRDSNKYCIRFGELDGAKGYDEDFLLKLPDGTVRTIHYHRRISNLIVPKAHQQWYLDSDRVDLPITIEYK